MKEGDIQINIRTLAHDGPSMCNHENPAYNKETDKFYCKDCGKIQGGLTNGGKPHICGEIAVHNGSREGVSICLKCKLPVDNPSPL